MHIPLTMAIWTQTEHVHNPVPGPRVDDRHAILKSGYRLGIDPGERRQGFDRVGAAHAGGMDLRG